MNAKNLHVVTHDAGWGIRREGATRVSKTYETQAAAERAARQTAIQERGEVFIHRQTGEIRERNSYGNDPFPPRG